MKSLRKLFIIVALLLSLAGLLAIFLPRILSSDRARRAVLSSARRKTGAALDVEKWSLTWRDGIDLSGVSYADARGEVAFEAAGIRTGAGIADLLGKRKNLGTVELLRPELRLTPAKHPPAAPRPEAPPERPAEPLPPAPPSAPAAPPRLPDIRGTVVVHDGRIVFAPPDTHPPLVLQDVDVRAEMTGGDAPLVFELSARQPAPGRESPAASGELSLKGGARLTRNGLLDLSRPSAEVDLVLKSVDIGPFATLGGAYADLPSAAGTLDGTAKISLESIENVSVKGELAARDVEMTGGPLGDDRPAFEEIAVAADMCLDSAGLAIERLTARVPFGRLEASGTLRTPSGERIPRGMLSGNAEVDLAGLAAAFPSTLNIREDLRITGGKASLEGEVRSVDDNLEATALLRVRDLAGARGSEVLSLDSPLTVLLKGRRGEEGITVENVQVDASFARIAGSGTATAANLTASIDVGAALAEAAKFVNVGGARLGGQITARAQARRADTAGKVSAEVDGAWRNLEIVGGSLEIREPELKFSVKADADPAPKGAAETGFPGFGSVAVKAGLDADGPAIAGALLKGDKPVFDKASAAADFRLDSTGLAIERLSAALPFGRLEAKGTLRPAAGGKIPRGTLSGNAEVDLAGLAAAFPSTLNIRDDLRITGGKASIEGHFESDAEGLAVNAVLRVSDLAGRRADEPLSLESPLYLLVKGRHGPKGASVERLQFDSSFGRISGSGSPAAIDLEMDLNMADAMAEAAKFIDVGKTRLGGKMTARVRTRPSEAKDMPGASVEAVWKDFEFAGESIDLREPEVKLGMEADVDGEDLVLRSLTLSSRPISISAAGRVSDWKRERTLDLQGTLTPDFALLGEMALPRDGVKLVMEGKTPGPCRIRAPLGGASDKPLLERVEADGRLQLSRLNFMGVDARGVDADLSMKSGRLRAALTAKLNEGELSVTPVFELGGGPPAVAIQEKTQVLKGVKLTDAMLSEMLATVSPLLRTSAVTGGTVDLAMEPCRLPLGKAFKRDAAFSGSVGFSDVVLAPAGPALELLQLVRLDPRAVAISNGTVAVTCSSGWVTATPLTLVSGKHHMRLAGSVSLDGPLKYAAELPITEKMVGAEVYEQVKGVYLKLPIGGTVAKPKIDAQSFRSLLGNAVKDAGGRIIVDQGTQLLNKFLKKLEEKQAEKNQPPQE